MLAIAARTPESTCSLPPCRKEVDEDQVEQKRVGAGGEAGMQRRVEELGKGRSQTERVSGYDPDTKGEREDQDPQQCNGPGEQQLAEHDTIPSATGQRQP